MNESYTQAVQRVRSAQARAQAAADLRQARREIEARGWCRGYMRDPETGAVCAVGGIRQAVVEGTEFNCLPPDLLLAVDARDLQARAALQLYLLSQGVRSTIPVWNDMMHRTQADVVEALDKAAAWIEEQA